MKKIGKILLWILGIILFLIGNALVLLSVYEDDIKKIAIEEVNKNLAVPMKVKSYDVTIFKTFPNISLHFVDVEISESSKIANKPFAKAKEIFLVFNILDVINEDYTISKIMASQGEINVYEQGDSVNYLIVKSSGADTVESAFSLQDLVLTDMHFEYGNDKNESFISMKVEELKVKGDFATSGSLLEFSGNGFNDSLTLGDKTFMKDKEFEIISNFSFTTQSLVFKETNVSFQNFALNLDGSIDLLEKGNKYDLKYKTSNAPLSSLIGLLPNEYLKEINEFKAVGDFELEGVYKGTSSNKENPHLETSFSIRNASILEPHTNKEMKNISLKGTYTNGKGNNAPDSDLALQAIKFNLSGKEMNGEFRMNDFDNPFINMKIKGETNLEDWNGFILSSGITLKGNAIIDAQYKGKSKDLKKGLNASQKSQGTIILKDVSYKKEGSNLIFNQVNGTFRFDGSNLEFKNFKGAIAGNTFQADGKLVRIIPYLVGAEKKLIINTQVNFDKFSLNSFTDKVTKVEESEIVPYKIPDYVKLQSNIRVKNFSYNKIELENIKTSLNMNNGRMVVSNFTSQMLGGTFGFSADLKNYENERLLGKMIFTGQDLDAKMMFYQFSNFGQETLTDKHLEGVIKAKVSMGTVFNKDLSLDEEMFYAHVNLVINNGRLKNFEPLEAMSSYIKIDELRDIKFKQLENDFEIKEGEIILPQMKISNSALNLSIGGTHSFKNYMKYNIQVKLADVLKSKYGNILKSKNQSEDGTKVFMKMEGTPDDLKFSLDKLQVKEVVKETVKEEKKTVKDLINKEFFKKEEKDSSSKEKIIEKEQKNTEWEE